MSTNRETDSAVVVMVTAVVGVYVWVMGTLLEMFGWWLAAAGSALLRSAGYL